MCVRVYVCSVCVALFPVSVRAGVNICTHVASVCVCASACRCQCVLVYIHTYM